MMPEDLPTDDDDARRRLAIMDAADPKEIVERIYAFYRDKDRADRTPREILYLHLGLLSGAVMRALDERPTLRRREPRIERPKR